MEDQLHLFNMIPSQGPSLPSLVPYGSTVCGPTSFQKKIKMWKVKRRQTMDSRQTSSDGKSSVGQL